MSRFIMVNGHPVSPERAALLGYTPPVKAEEPAPVAPKQPKRVGPFRAAVIAATRGGKIGENASAAVADAAPALTGLEKARSVRAANVAARKAALLSDSSASDVIAAKDLGGLPAPVASTVTPEQLAEADALVAAGGLAAQEDATLAETKLALNAEAGAAAQAAGAAEE